MLKRFCSLVALVVLCLCLIQVRHFWLKKGNEGTATAFTVHEGENGSMVAHRLKEQGLIPSVFWFRQYLRIDAKSRDLQVGAFSLEKGMNYRSIVERLSVSYQEEVVITIPEGLTLDATYDRINAVLPIDREEWNRYISAQSPLGDDDFLVSAKKPATVTLEGYLFPDTYHFFTTATAEEVVRTMLNQMEKKTKGLALGEHESLHEALTLASIIEKEVRKPETMAIVSGIFHNRLRIGMALQADATVNYLTGKGHASALLKDTEIDSPYNTYKYSGLPPGPIAGAGMNAINASVRPTKTDYFYYLTSPEGTIHYANTFEEHISNRQYLR